MGEKQEGSDNNKQSEGQSKGDAGVTTVILKFDMHCDGCAKKIKRSIKNFPGVENVKTEVSAGKLTVVGKVDPVKIKERIEEKTNKKVEVLSLQQNKPANKEGGAGAGAGGEKKSDEKKPDEKKSDAKSSDNNKKSDEKKSENNKKSEEKKDKPKEPPVTTVLLKTRVHCDGCAQKIKKIVDKCAGVQDVNVDLQKDTITVKGTMNMKDLLPYLNLKLKRSVELGSPKKDEGAGGDKKPKEGGGGGEKPKEGGSGEKPKGGGEKPKEGGSSEKVKGGDEKKQGGGGGEKKDGSSSNGTQNVTKIEVNKMEFNPYGYGPYGYGSHAYTYDPRQQGEIYGHQVVEYWHTPEFSQPPQMFSDENPNACSVM